MIMEKARIRQLVVTYLVLVFILMAVSMAIVNPLLEKAYYRGYALGKENCGLETYNKEKNVFVLVLINRSLTNPIFYLACFRFCLSLSIIRNSNGLNFLIKYNPA